MYFYGGYGKLKAYQKQHRKGLHMRPRLRKKNEATLRAWRYIAFRRAAKGFPPLNLSSLDADDIRRVYYFVGQVEGERSRGGKQ